jgi:hypothetical protein
MHAYVRACMHNMHTCLHTYINIYIHTCSWVGLTYVATMLYLIVIIHMHACIRTHMHACIMHACILTYICSSTRAVGLGLRMRQQCYISQSSYICTCMRTYAHACIYAYIHTYICAYTHEVGLGLGMRQQCYISQQCWSGILTVIFMCLS